MTGYMICATPRSGSTLLCSLLRSSGVAGHPQSWFRAQNMAEFATDWGIARAEGGFDWPDYLQAALAAGRGGGEVFGLRLMWVNLDEVLLRLGGGGREALERALGPLRYVHLYRRDLVAQAVSRHKAEASGIWHLGIEEAAVPGVPRYDFAAIDGYVREAEADNRGWEGWFAAEGIAPLRLAYEDLSLAPEASAERVLVYLGLPAGQRLRAANVRMADAVSADWVLRYRAEAGLSAG